jgi:hypothetical protein
MIVFFQIVWAAIPDVVERSMRIQEYDEQNKPLLVSS